MTVPCAIVWGNIGEILPAISFIVSSQTAYLHDTVSRCFASPAQSPETLAAVGDVFGQTLSNLP